MKKGFSQVFLVVILFLVLVAFGLAVYMRQYSASYPQAQVAVQPQPVGNDLDQAADQLNKTNVDAIDSQLTQLQTDEAL